MPPSNTDFTDRPPVHDNSSDTTDDLPTEIVLPDGTVVKHEQQFTWCNDRYALLIRDDGIRFRKNPNTSASEDIPWVGPEVVAFIQFDTPDEFRDWYREEHTNIEFHDPPSFVGRLRAKLPL